MTRTLALVLGAALALAGGVAARPAYDFAPVDADAQALVARYNLPGASLRLSRNGVVVYRKTYGGYDGNERLAIASASKWLSALTLARLVERGQLRWDSTVGEFFPDAPASVRGITVAQLFSHTSGMVASDVACISDRQTTLQQCARDILAVPLAAPPGTTFSYGGNSMHVAGAMAEIATGQAWDDLFIAQVVEPLGLTDTDWTGGASRDEYVRNPNPRIAGGARSSLDDYGRLMDMVLAGGLHQGQSFLRADTLATMALDRAAGLVVVNSPVADYNFGYGIGQWVEAKDAAGATYRVSSPGAFGFTPWVDWQSGSSGVLLVSGNGGLMRDDLTALEGRCLEQLDFTRSTNSTTKPAVPVAAPSPTARTAKPALRARATLDATRRAL